MDSKTTTLINKIVENRPLSHFLFWLVFLLTASLWSSLEAKSFSHYLTTNLAILPAQLMATYLLVYFQIPQLLLKKKYVQFVFSLLLAIFIFTAIARIFIVYIAEPFIRKDFEQESLIEILTDPIYLLVVYFPAVYLVSFYMFSVKSFKNLFEEKHQLEVLQKEKATNELKFLKAQIHPHFLFNTLNNLYALTLAKSDAAPEVVVKLSALLDYILNQCNEPLIEIHKEVKLIEGYVELEMLRYGENLDLVFNHEVDDGDTPMAPLILLSIIENAFKHGASGNPSNPKIHIDLKIKDGQLYLKVFNNKLPVNLQKEKNTKRNKIGNANLKRQLELYYPNKYQLKIDETLDSYIVVLKIDLNSTN